MVQMPELITCRLTFSVVMSIFERLMSQPSGLMRECLILAALKSAELDAVQDLRVEVRPAEVDPRAEATADIAIWQGPLIQELFLVTPRAGLSATMTARASRLLENLDLRRVHVLTQLEDGRTPGEHTVVMSMISGGTFGFQDISLVDIRSKIESITDDLPRPLLRTALHRLDQYLRAHADPALADEYVLSLYDTRPEIVRDPAGV